MNLYMITMNLYTMNMNSYMMNVNLHMVNMNSYLMKMKSYSMNMMIKTPMSMSVLMVPGMDIQVADEVTFAVYLEDYEWMKWLFAFKIVYINYEATLPLLSVKILDRSSSKFLLL